MHFSNVSQKVEYRFKNETTKRLLRLVSPSKAKELVLTGAFLQHDAIVNGVVADCSPSPVTLQT